MKIKMRLALVAAGILGAGVLQHSSVRAADHADGPAAIADPTSDVDDVYAWMSPDAADLNLVMTIGKDVPRSFQLSDKVQYVFHTTSRSAFGAAAGAEYNIICEADASTQIRCWVGNDEFVGGDASSTQGLESKDGKVKIFAGVRNDPFFFNLTGLKNVEEIVGNAAPSLSFDPAGCPKLDSATSNLLVNTLKTGKDDFLDFSAFALVVQLDKGLVTKNGPIVSVWVSTHRKAA
jgi:hypothetical protein